jgi:P-type E1-E2 ATPase
LNSRTDTTLAIGDGSNDVAMIHAADIGIGLYGLEGSEASSSADYALCEFKHTRRLLFYHGMHYGTKMKNYINWYMFKTTLYALLPLMFSFYDGYSG